MKNGDSRAYIDITRDGQNNETVECPRGACRAVKACDTTLSKASVLLFLLLVLAIVAPTPALHAQVSGATLTGTVTDPSGAVIPNAELSIQNVATGTARQLTTDSAGIYAAPNLMPGTYEVMVTAAGFETAVRKGVTLTVGAQQLMNFSLKIGGSTQQVEVTTGTLGVELASSEISGVVTQ